MVKKFHATPDLAFTTILVFGVCGIAYILVGLTMGTVGRLLPFAIPYFGLLLLIWYGTVRGTYALIDTSKDLLQASRFFIRTSLSLNTIKSIQENDTFGGIITEVRVLYTNRKGKQRMTRIMSKQAFKKGDYESFIQFLHAANSKINLPKG